MNEEETVSSSVSVVEKVLLESELEAERSDGANEGDTTWVQRREKLVTQALKDEDHEALERIAALPGGFGTEELRQQAWPALLRTKWFFPQQQESSDSELDTQENKGGVEDGKELLKSEEPEQATQQEEQEHAPHPDENQVLLDTKRSFVVYPKDLYPQTKLSMQADLQALIVHILRLYPTLSYFQGFHDIMSVLYLTFIPLPLSSPSRSRSVSVRSRDRSGTATPFNGAPTVSNDGSVIKLSNETPTEKSPQTAEKSPGSEEMEVPNQSENMTEKSERGRQNETPSRSDATPQNRDTPAWNVLRRCAEVVSICRVRDAMGHGMEPMMGLLKLLQRLSKAADPELSKFSASISPVPTLPFFALSWILCLFSHDIDTLEPVQRMFDFLLSRNPISAIYLAVAILIAKKDQMFRLAKQKGEDAEDDPSLLHPLFARLPPLFADTPDQPEYQVSAEKGGSDSYNDPNPYDPIPISHVFSIADELMARFPWDGSVMRGNEVLGPGSTIRTYANEDLVHQGEWSLKAAEAMVDVDVMMPGGTEPDEEEEEAEPLKKVQKIRRRSNKGGLTIAVGIAVVGVSIALYGFKAGGSRAGWVGWWATVIKSWAGKSSWEETVIDWRKVLGNVMKSVREVMY